MLTNIVKFVKKRQSDEMKKKKDDKKKGNEMTKFDITEEFREVHKKVEMDYFQ